MSNARPYHHGDLRKVVLVAALDAIEEAGPTAVSLRDLARRAGVSHAAPAHHFGDKAGLLTAVASEGFDLMADALNAANDTSKSFVETGVAYVRFAIDHRAHFEVMHRPDLYHVDDPAALAARTRAREALYRGVALLEPEVVGPDVRVAGVAAWSIVHGFASLWLTGAVPAALGPDPEAATRAVAGMLFRGP